MPGGYVPGAVVVGTAATRDDGVRKRDGMNTHSYPDALLG